MIAAWRGHSSIVTELVRAGAQIDAQDQVCITCMHYYVRFLGNARFITCMHVYLLGSTP